MVALLNMSPRREPCIDLAIERTLRVAKRASHRAYLRVYLDTVDLCFLRYLELDTLASEQAMAWADGKEDRSFVAIGVEAASPIYSTIRFARAGIHCLEVCEQSIEVELETGEFPAETMPVAVGGFSFAPRTESADEIWDGWGDGMFWVPTFLFQRYGQKRRVCITQVVQPDDDRHELEERIAEKLARLQELEVLGGEREALVPAELNLGKALADEPAARDGWCEKVNQVRQSIADGHVDKVVLARTRAFEAPVGQTFSPTRTLERLRERYHDCKVFMVRGPDGACFVGATPELFLRLDGQSVETVSLAGTARRGSTDEQDSHLGQALLESKKDRYEHQVVTHAICSALAPVTSQLDVNDEPHLLRLNNVQHLETRISAQLDRPRTIMELLSRLHPTPAVGGEPREAALDWIAAHEELDRGWYAGLVGWVGAAGEGLFAVAIRSAVLRGNRAWAFAGAGIVEDSDPVSEWDETTIKLEAIGKNLVMDEMTP
jgi:isochorismate synthase